MGTLAPPIPFSTQDSFDVVGYVAAGRMPLLVDAGIQGGALVRQRQRHFRLTGDSEAFGQAQFDVEK